MLDQTRSFAFVSCLRKYIINEEARVNCNVLMDSLVCMLVYKLLKERTGRVFNLVKNRTVDTR